MFSESLMKKIGIFAGGVLFGTAGVKILSGRDAKKVYTECTAAALRAKDCVMKTVTTVQENAEDILAEAQGRRRKRRLCRRQRKTVRILPKKERCNRP